MGKQNTVEGRVKRLGSLAFPFHARNVILLPIHKIYSDQLFSGEKKYEYRKSVPKCAGQQIEKYLWVSTSYIKGGIDGIVVYESSGSGKVVGILKVHTIMFNDPWTIWCQTMNGGGIDRDGFFRYFEGRDVAYAYVIETAIRFKKPLELKDFGLSKPPQNFVWLLKEGEQ